MIPQHIFKAYDIRGLVASELSPELAYRVGYYFVTWLKEQSQASGDGKVVIVGRDMRPSSPGFQAEVIRGIREAGFNALDIGLVSTPLFNFSCTQFPESMGGIMITASHNPAEYNGFKATLKNGTSVPGVSFLPCLETNFSPAATLGSLQKRDPLPEYEQRIFSLVKPAEIKPLKIVIDAGNGMAAATFPYWLKKVPVSVEYLYLEPDGTFPNHEANPLKTETLRALQAKVKELNADFGFALDGDCDRIGLVDEKGEVVEASFVGALLGLEVLRDHPKANMLFGLTSSQVVAEAWFKAGATRVEACPPGHAKIKKMMKESKAQFASELSGHLYYHELTDVESSDLSLLYVLRLLSREGRTLSQIIAPLKKYAHSGEINFKVADPKAVLVKLENEYENKATAISRLDGVSFRFDWGWFNVRASNTEPLLRLNLEANTVSAMAEKVTEVSRVINR